MKSSLWFKYMDMILIMNGLNIYKYSGKFNFIKWLLRGCSILYSHILLCHSILTYVNRMDDPYSLLFLMQLFFGVVSFQSIIRNRRKIASIVEEVCSCSNQVILSNLFRASKAIFILWLLVLFLQTTLLSCQWYFLGTQKWMSQFLFPTAGPITAFHHFIVACDITFWVLFVIGFVVGAICSFVYILFCLNKLYMNRMKNLAEKLEMSQTLARNLECFREVRAKYQGLKETANDIFGLTVCGYFAECYLETGLRLANDDSNIQKSLYTLVTDWGLYGLQVLILLAFILFLSKLSDREEACEKRLLRKLVANRCRSYDIDYQKMMLVIEITQSPIVPVTGWNVFVINRSLLLGFLGSVIPFAVLIASLFEKTKNITNYHCSNYTLLLEGLFKNRTNPNFFVQ